MMHDPRPLAGYRFLIVEDEMMLAWRIGDMLIELGGTVGKIATRDDQSWEALGTRWDCGIVDLNLKCKPAWLLLWSGRGFRSLHVAPMPMHSMCARKSLRLRA